MVASLGIFKYNPIIGRGELETIKSVHKVQMMPIYPKELLLGSDKYLDQGEPNNNKFENLMVISEDEKQVYLAPSSLSATETGSFFDKQTDKRAASGHASNTLSSSISFSTQ